MTPRRTSMLRRAALVALAALTASTVVVAGTGNAGALPTGNEAQLKDANAFFRNSFAEVGARPNGSFGSSTVQPDGWHGNFKPSGDGPVTPGVAGVGFRSDRGKDGWGVGRDDGDFFLPGTPFEAWSVQTSGATFYNSHNFTGVDGSFVSADSTGDPSVVWDSSDASSGVLVRQVMSVPAAGTQQLNVDVTLTNPTGTDVVARYGRAVDADNCVQYPYGSSICDQDGDGVADPGSFYAYDTRNTIKSQRTAGDNTSAVGATQTDGSELVLWTSEEDSKVVGYTRTPGSFCGNADLTSLAAVPLTATPASTTQVPCGPESGAAFAAVGSSFFVDESMALVVRKTVPANGSVTFRVSYSLSTDAYTTATTAGVVDLTEGPLDTMTAGTAFTSDLAATGIATPTYTVTAGTLPAGLTLDPATGNISGTPTTAGPYDFSVTASGTEGSATKQYTGTVLAAPGVPPTWTNNTIGELVTGRPFTDGVAASGDGPITYLILGALGSLPEGLTIDPATGAVTGTPTTPGPFDFTIAATNEFGFITQQFTGVVGAPPAWTDNALAAPTAGRPYTDGVAASGTGPVTYAVTAGRLPAGLTLNAATGAVTGTPTAAGPALFVITATNAYGSVSQGFGVVVAAAPATGVMGAVSFVGQTGKLLPEGRRALDLLAAAVPRGATNVKVQVFGWAEAKRTTRAVLQLGATRVRVTTAELQRRGVAGVYSGKVGGRYPVPGKVGRRSEVVITWDNPVS